MPRSHERITLSKIRMRCFKQSASSPTKDEINEVINIGINTSDCLQAKRRRRIVKPKHISRNIHENRPHRRMIFWNARKQAREQRADHAPEKRNDPSVFSNLHDSHPKRQHAGKPQRQFKSRLGRIERRCHDRRPNIDIAIDKRFVQRENTRHYEKPNPNIIQYHIVIADCCVPMKTGHKFSAKVIKNYVDNARRKKTHQISHKRHS